MAATNTIPVSSKFSYEPLPSVSSSIRLAILQPGERNSPIKVTLHQTTFALRPRYKALSYTWGSADSTKAIKLNGQAFGTTRNLWEALVHLRSPIKELPLWVDAICIDQSNILERNEQVGLMAYIYTRAERVIVWLGIISLPEASGSDESATSSPSELSLVCAQPYWNRVWIVQEIGAAGELEVRWECARVDSQPLQVTERVHPWATFFDLVQDTTGSEFPQKLWSQREKRHGDAFLLANLMEVCRDSLCAEPRDKVYGFVGIAHDCQDGSLPVDYSKSLFQVYEDVIRFHHKSSAAREGRSFNDVVFFSQLVQKLLGGKRAMDEDFSLWASKVPDTISSHYFCSPTKEPTFNAVTLSVAGRYSGQISIIGPLYEDMVGNPHAMKEWKISLSKFKRNVEEIRKKDELFMRTLLALDPVDLEKIQPLETIFMTKLSDRLLHRLGFSKDSPEIFKSLPLHSAVPPLEHHRGEGHRLFATANGVLGLIPSNAQVGDMIFQFEESDVVAIARLDDNCNYSRILGRGVIAHPEPNQWSTFQSPSDFLNPSGKGYGMEFDGTTIQLDVDLLTLHLLTC